MIDAFLGFAALLLLIFLRVPIAFAMMLVGLVGFGLVIGWRPSFISAAQATIHTTQDYSLLVIPLFLLMGNLISRSGLSGRLYDATYAWLGHRPGGLARATIVSCAGFSAVCGSSLATTATMAKIAVPQMKRLGYSPELSAGAIAAGGTLGILIPPSVIMVLYGVLTQTDIAALFIAGVIPGVMGIMMYNLAVTFVVRRAPQAGPAGPVVSWREKWSALLGVWEIVLLFALVIGGIYFGLFTPNEAAGVGAFGALLSTVFRRTIGFGQLVDVFYETAVMSATLIVVLIGAFVFSNFLNMTGMPRQIGEFVAGNGYPVWLVMALIILAYLVLGMILDSISMILLTIPVFFPLVQFYGLDPIWFGIIIVVVTEISLITPPVGMNIFVLASVVPEMQIRTIYRGVIPFIAADFLRLALLLAFPALSLFLPNMMN
ncbi:TRAP transporter large permease [Pararhodobacter oceanensis]|uniref:TRAP transporter large permease n=1 Tax=Pararhodobacter oceanensis TaxID=2172121 RepID=UPI003A920BA8